MIIIKSDREILLMRDAGKIVAIALDAVGKAIAPGIPTAELDEVARKTIVECGAIPTFKGYHGYPANICVSVNSEVVHGIPGARKLEEGDIVSVDCGALYNGYNGDAAVTFPVGKVSEDALRLMRVTREALYKGIEQAVVGNRLGAVSHAIQQHAEAAGYGVVRDYCGHGIGRNMHEDPSIPNVGEPDKGPLIKAGMVLAIEPMVNMGTWAVKVLADDWTVVTKDGKISAHFEHTVAVTTQGPQILTKLED